LSIYLIVLSCLPCTDLEAKSAVHSSQEILLIADNHSHEKNSDSCSPFCVCNCCGGQGFTYIIDYNWNFNSVNAIIDKKTPEYKSILTSNFYGSIWQPPQIA
jgi:hypothetical protein